MSLRHLMLAAIVTTVLGGWIARGIHPVTAAEAPSSKAAPGAVTVESLGTLLSAIGLKPTRTESRYDFAFAQKHGEDWELSMSVVLSNDQKTIWLMAWLDELPQSAADVPRTALLRLLADNDKMGAGQFFAYVASNRRFVLQRVILNEHISTSGFREILTDLGKTVVNTYPHWAVANWKQIGTSNAAAGEEEDDAGQGTAGSGKTPAATPKAASGRSSSTRK
jgi:hypothetical protein